MPLVSRAPRLLAGVLLTLLFAACSTIKLGYNNADFLAVHAIDRYVDLDAEQEQMVRQRIGALLAWHRATQLTDYAGFIQEARSGLGGFVTAAEVRAFNEGLNRRLALLAERAAPDAAALALTLTPAQIDQLERKLLDDSIKARKESEREVQEALDARAKKYAERSEFWFGKLTPAQLQVVKTSLSSRPTESLYWLEARERRTRALVELLRRIHAEKPAEAVAAEWFQAYFAELRQPSDPEQRARADAFRRDNAILVAQLINSATPEQRLHLDRRLAGFQSELVQLATRDDGPG